MDTQKIIDSFNKFQRELNDLLVKAIRTGHTPKYERRTEAEHNAIRAALRVPFKNCDHLKGHLMKPTLYSERHKDYNVSLFIFADGSQRIRCNKCGHKWFKNDPDWALAVDMVRQSTNRPASSEWIEKP